MGTRVYQLPGNDLSRLATSYANNGPSAVVLREDLPYIPVRDVPRTVYVSTDGSDFNDGSQARPFRTIHQAYADRTSYAIRDCAYTIQLVGAGPFEMPITGGGWLHFGNAITVIRGDPSAEQKHFRGQFAGGFIGTEFSQLDVIGGGLGNAGEHVGRWIRYLGEGAVAGQTGQIIEHTDSQLTLAAQPIDRDGVSEFREFEIWTPGTITIGPSTMSGIMTSDPWYGTTAVIFENIRFEDFAWFELLSVSFFGCEFVSYLGLVAVYGNQALYYGSDQAFPENPKKWGQGGFRCFAGMTIGAASFFQILSGVFGDVEVHDGSSLTMNGARLNKLQVAGGCTVFLWASRATALRVDATITVQTQGSLRMTKGPQGIGKFAVASGDCIRVASGALCAVTLSFTGGTSAPTGYGVNTASGGKFYIADLPRVTGGTSGKDLKTTNTSGAANSVLSVLGAVSNDADAKIGEVLARIAEVPFAAFAMGRPRP